MLAFYWPIQSWKLSGLRDKEALALFTYKPV